MRFFVFLVFSGTILAGDLSEAIENGRVLVDLRLRLESVDQDNLPEESLAPTLRTRFGYQTADLFDWQLLLEFENLTSFDDDNYNDTQNGLTDYPVINDPEGSEVNRVFLRWKPDENRSLTLGRQRIVLDGQRFLGRGAWRQREQTFDGVVYRESFGRKNTLLTLGYLNQTSRANGDMDSFIGNLRLAETPIGNATLLAYFLDFNERAQTSHRNLGVRLEGRRERENLTWLWDLAYVQQEDYADGGDFIDADYSRIAAGVIVSGVTFHLEQETLGGDGTYGFQTPLASRHGPNGWADRFLNTPAGGLVDSFVKIAYSHDKWTLMAFYHQFEADTGGDYGTEFDFLVSYAFDKQTDLTLKVADFSEDGFGPDVTKIFLYGQYRM